MSGMLERQPQVEKGSWRREVHGGGRPGGWGWGEGGGVASGQQICVWSCKRGCGCSACLEGREGSRWFLKAGRVILSKYANNYKRPYERSG